MSTGEIDRVRRFKAGVASLERLGRREAVRVRRVIPRLQLHSQEPTRNLLDNDVEADAESITELTVRLREATGVFAGRLPSIAELRHEARRDEEEASSRR